MRTQKLMWIVWPAFLAACVLELVVFAFVDPRTCISPGMRWPCPGRGCTP